MFGVGLCGLVGFGNSGLWDGWCCASVLGIWGELDCFRLRIGLWCGFVCWCCDLNWVWVGCDCCCFEFDYNLVWVVDDCFGGLMVVLMRIWWLCDFRGVYVCLICLGFCLCEFWCCFVYYAGGFSLVA